MQPDDPRLLHVLSLGVGVQSVTLALRAEAGEIRPKPHCAIFSDPGDEDEKTYAYRDWLAGQLSFPIHTIRAWEGYGKPSIRARLSDELVAFARGLGLAGAHSRPPFYVKNPDGTVGTLNRQCTQDFKIDPIQVKVRELLGLRKFQRWPQEILVAQWIGISTDEAIRCKPITTRRRATAEERARLGLRPGQKIAIPHPTIGGRWPFLEVETRAARHDCLLWLGRRGFPIPPKSACIFCPYHDDATWLRLQQDATAWARIIEIDRTIRTGEYLTEFRGQLYLHRTCRPLEEIDFAALATEKARGDLFGNECEGMCGV